MFRQGKLRAKGKRLLFPLVLGLCGAFEGVDAWPLKRRHRTLARSPLKTATRVTVGMLRAGGVESQIAAPVPDSPEDVAAETQQHQREEYHVTCREFPRNKLVQPNAQRKASNKPLKWANRTPLVFSHTAPVMRRLGAVKPQPFPLSPAPLRVPSFCRCAYNGQFRRGVRQRLR